MLSKSQKKIIEKLRAGKLIWIERHTWDSYRWTRPNDQWWDHLGREQISVNALINKGILEPDPSHQWLMINESALTEEGGSATLSEQEEQKKKKLKHLQRLKARRAKLQDKIYDMKTKDTELQLQVKELAQELGITQSPLDMLGWTDVDSDAK